MTLDHIRYLATLALCAVAALLTTSVLGVDWLVQGSLGLASMLAVGALVGLGTTYACLRHGPAMRLMTISVLMTEIVALLIATKGHPWQTDIHMAFFAALAISALLYDQRVILLGAVLVAIHHLGMGMALDAMVFYGGGGLGRVALHAFVLVVEAVALVWMIQQTEKLLHFAKEKEEQAGAEIERATALLERDQRRMAAALDAQGQINAIAKSLGVIEFDTSGIVLAANDKFCAALGYQLEEIQGRHHRLFVEPSFSSSTEYQDFWARLGRGQFQEGEYLRIGKSGAPIWIQATYNPIFDADGKPYKVVKYATDITARKAAVALLGIGLGQLARGDLTARIDTHLVDELEDVRTAFNGSVAQFAGVIARLAGTSGALKCATGEILASANDLSERTTQQAAAVEETSMVMDQLAATVASNAKLAHAANTKTQTVSSTAEATGEVMRRAHEAMERITQSSAKISNIIGLIDDIAFQTNLLALNASVEAARAGDAGKGFAVVAVEVRRLAQSAAAASSDVKALVDLSGAEVASGTKLVTEAAQKLHTVLEDIHENSTLMARIAQASQEQSTAITQVLAATREMDTMTQHNAALVEEINAAIKQTEAQANALDRIVEVFVVDGSSSQSATAPSANHHAAEQIGDRWRRSGSAA